MTNYLRCCDNSCPSFSQIVAFVNSLLRANALAGLWIWSQRVSGGQMRTRMMLPLVALSVAVLSIAAAAQNEAQPSELTIHVRDYCDPTSFNAAIGSGTCDRDASTGAITFMGFLTELSMDKSVGAWRFAPSQARVAEGATLNLQNLGGETHTFTRVKGFGGGFVAPLNAAAGTPEPAHECAQMVDGNLIPQPPGPDNIFIPAGSTASTTLQPGETARFQCCIHPWMHVTITPKDEHHVNLK